MAKVLHISNGKFMMQDFEKNGHINERFRYVPFNEVMCWRETDELIVDLLQAFPQYGLGDLQYEMLINQLIIEQ